VTLLLAILYPIAVQYERGGWWRLLAPVTVLALLIDVVANYTELALLTWDFPRKGEYTFSTRLLRLRYDTGATGAWCREVIRYLNFFAPNGKHV
jgi:hypothetical protein